MPKNQIIAQLGHPILKERTVEVNDIKSPSTQQIIDDMLHTVKLASGVGIAAPQIHQSKRIFIICSSPSSRYPDAPEMQPTAMINPKVTWHGKETTKSWEGCLSVPSLRGLVPRYSSIEISYFDREGNEHHKKYTDFLARVFQHELDHLDGLTFVDRVESVQDLISESEWHRQYN